MTREELIDTIVGERFRVLRLLGTGAIGHVYLGAHLHLDRWSAIKVLRSEYAGDSEIVGRFRREAEANSRLDHPNIVRLEGFGELPDGRLYLIMEYIDGPTLRDVQRASAPLPLHRALSIVHQLCSAVAFAHEKSIIHRDLKPENVLLIPRKGRLTREHVKVLDFGLAKLLGSKDTTVETLEGQVFGTPAYMSPEQCLGSPADHRTDIYSLGVIAYELLAGRLPFKATKAIDYMLQHAKATPEDPSTHRPGKELSSALSAAVLRCLAKVPEDRWPEVAAFQRIVDEHLELARVAAEKETGLIDAAHLFGEASTVPAPAPQPAESRSPSDGEARRAPDDEEVRQLLQRGAPWLFSRFCQITRTIAKRLARDDDDAVDLRTALQQAAEAEDALLRRETDIAFLEAEVDGTVARIHARINELHEQLITLEAEHRALSRDAPQSPERDIIEQQIAALERNRLALESERDRETARLEAQIESLLLELPDLQRASADQHIALGNLLEIHRPEDPDPKLVRYYTALDQCRRALSRTQP